MSRTILIDCAPRRPSDGVVVPVRLVFKAVARANFMNAQWHPAVVSVPAFEASLGFDGRSFGDRPSPQIGELVFALTDGTRHAGSLVWANAAVTIKMAPWTAGANATTGVVGGDPADGDFITISTGLAESISTGKGEARVRLLDNGQALRVPALAGKFGSTGDALLDGADALKDRTADSRVPRAWGKLLSIPGLLVDRANGVWLFAGNAATSVQAFYDGGATFTLGTARASLAALQANVPAAGTVDYCLDAGGKFLARSWTTPTYPFTAAATFGSTTAADIASAIVTSRTAVTFEAGTVAAFNSLQGAEHGLYLDDETSVASALDRLFSGLGAWWRLSGAGTITIGRWAWAAPTLTVAAHRRHAPDRLRIIPPTRRRSLGYARNNRVHSESEIARILLAGDLAYADGTSIEALKPGQIGADVTATKTAAAIAGQGTLATQNNVSFGGQISGLPNALTDIEFAGFIKASNISWAYGFTVQDLKPGEAGANRTEIRVAASISGQGVLATRNRVTLGAAEGGLTNQANDTWLLDASIITSFGTASAISGQSFLATNYPARLGPHPYFGSTYLDANFIAYDGPAGNVVGALKPEEAGGNRTEIRVAASFSGQGGLATRSHITLGIGGGITDEGYTFWLTTSIVVTSAGTAAAIAGQGALATQNTVDYATQVTGAPPAGGQVTVGLGQQVKKYLGPYQSVFADGAFGADGSTASYGYRESTLLVNGSVFATGGAWSAGPGEPGSGTVSGSWTNGATGQLVNITVSYNGSAVSPDYSQVFCRA